MKLSEDQIQAFQSDGYLVAENMVTDADMAPVIAEYETWTERRAEALLAEEKITYLAAGQPFGRRFATLYAQTPEIGEGMDIMAMRGAAMFAFLHNSNLLDAVESLIGSEITCNPIHHVRAKPPESLSEIGRAHV